MVDLRADPKYAVSPDGPTQFGFKWGPISVVRVTEIEGNRILEVRTAREVLTVRVTPTGLIRESKRKRGTTEEV